MKIITIKDGVAKMYDTVELMFQGLSEEGLIIDSLEEGVIKGKIETTEVEVSFGHFVSEGTKETTLKEIEAYRNDLRVSVAKLQKQGLIEKAQLNKLAAQFEFLKNSTKTTKTTKTTKAAKATEDAEA